MLDRHRGALRLAERRQADEAARREDEVVVRPVDQGVDDHRVHAVVEPADGSNALAVRAHDLILAVSGSNGLHSIEDVFKAMANETPALAGLSLSKIGDLGIDLSETAK